MRALCLGGGGSKGAYQVGVLKKWMGDDKTDYQILCGTSVGAINAAYLAQTAMGDPAKAVERLSAQWQQVNNAKIKKSWQPFGVLTALFRQSVYNSSPLHVWIQNGLDPVAIRESGRKLRVVSTSLTSGEAYVADETADNISDWVIASSGFPVMLNPIEINGSLFTDGGLRNVTPLGEAIRAGATEIDIIMCSDPFGADPWDHKGKKAIPDLLLRAISIIGDQVSRADLEICGIKNELAALSDKYRSVKIRIIRPKTTLIEDSLNFDPAEISRMTAIGYADALSAVYE
jgi:predicted acylesterase/phospholipase RssA